MLDVIHISKNIDGKEVLTDCTFSVLPGTIYGIVGINGVGKSTLMKICCGILKPDNGTVLLGTKTVYNNFVAKRDIIFIPDDPYYELNDTVNNLAMFYNAFYKVDYDYLKYLLEILEVNLNDKLVKLSKGKRKRTYLAIALSIAPKIIILDETFDGLDPKAKKTFKSEVYKLLERKDVSLILTSHSLRELSDIATNIGYLKEGKLINLGDIEYKLNPLYRIIIKENIKALDSLNILKKTIINDFLICDVLNTKDEISNMLKDKEYSIDIVPFEDWICYQMEELA